MKDGDVERTLTDRGEQTAGAGEVFAPHLFVAFECSRPGAGSSRHSLAGVEEVLLERGAARGGDREVHGSGWNLRLRIPDLRMSSRHATLGRDRDGWFVEDLASRNGTRVNGARITGRARLADGDLLEVGHSILRYRASLACPVGSEADADLGPDHGDDLIRTIHPSLAARVRDLTRVSDAGAPILVLGESGTGKELLARAIHRRSARSGPFVAVNCGALPASLVEAQLFGHVRGAFSGALTSAPGLVRSAEGGTLLLDEVGDLPAASQAVLLRVLQEREVLPLGGTQPVKVDVRVLAATHRPLRDLVARGDFRADLFARIAAFTFEIPPLRERPEDIGLMIQAFARGRSLRLTPAAARALLRYEWPLNARELHQTLVVGAALAGEEAIDADHLPGVRASNARATLPPDPVDPVRERLVASMARHGGNISEVARELGKARMQVQRWLRRYGIDARSFRN
ncbi:MAG TPA: sigma 54-interacting transcriptional regulator [Polyangiaceae bacterium]|jgi:transcriptional regulator with AAA-type ATPase domain